MDNEDLNQRLIDVEIEISHMQKAVDELSEMVIKQGKIIEHLQRQNLILQSALETDVVKPLNEETPPPHY